MAVLRPFRAVRPAKGYEKLVMAKPYDVMNRKEAERMAQDNPNSFLHITRAEIDLPEEENPYSEKVYKKAKENIDRFLENGTLMMESKPMLYIYRQTMNGNVQTGIVGCVSIDDYENNVIKKHEFTRHEKEVDRINHFDICNANTESVFLTYRDNKKIRLLTEGYINNNEKEYDIQEDGVRHEIWAIKDDNVINGICGLFATIPAFYIADGHHRTASAYKVGQKRRKKNPDYTGIEEFNYFLATVFPDDDLKVFDYNRVVRDLNGNSKEEFINKIEEMGFTVKCLEEEPYRPDEPHCFGMYLDGHWYKLVTKDEIISEGIIESLDVSILQNNILEPILGIKDVRTDSRIDFVGGIRGLKELERRVQTDMAVAFCLHPVAISDIMTISDNQMIMPPKSTWFEPKLGSGLFMHML